MGLLSRIFGLGDYVMDTEVFNLYRKLAHRLAVCIVLYSKLYPEDNKSAEYDIEEHEKKLRNFLYDFISHPSGGQYKFKSHVFNFKIIRDDLNMEGLVYVENTKKMFNKLWVLVKIRQQNETSNTSEK